MTKIAIYDTTLRDGMQAEGVSFSLPDKLSIAQCLDGLGVDYIEGGYAASNPKEMQFFHEVSKLGLERSKVAAFGSTRRADCTVEEDVSLNSILATRAPAATIVGKTWDLHVGMVLGCSLDENLTICAESIRYLKGKGLEAIFDAEHFFDGYKANPEYAMRVLASAAEAGADALVLCDTNGGSLPHQVLEIAQQVCNTFGSVVVGIHTHNDSDCATANALAAVQAGARHVQGTINGLGERCGNANLCSVIPNLAFKMGLEPLDAEKIKSLTEVSRFVFEIANLPPVMNLPYVGDSAFAHKAGLHVDALRKSRQTYEHIDPEMVGNERRFLISELSGKSNILAELEKAKITQDKTLARRILTRELRPARPQDHGDLRAFVRVDQVPRRCGEAQQRGPRHRGDSEAEGRRRDRARGRRGGRSGQRAGCGAAQVTGDLLSQPEGGATVRLQSSRGQRERGHRSAGPGRDRIEGQTVDLGNGRRFRERDRSKLAGAGR
jgi:2-isopropylmalate synthase